MSRGRHPARLGNPNGLIVLAPKREASLRRGQITSRPMRNNDPTKEAAGEKPWKAKIDSQQPKAMFGAGNRIYLADAGRLQVLDLNTGDRRGSLTLTLPGAETHDPQPLLNPVKDGCAVAYEHLFVSGADGRLHCFTAASAEAGDNSESDR
jgi:hypothetical protein